jgi:hypothetical protein
MCPREPCNVAWVRRARQSSPAGQSAPGDSSRAGACCNKWNDKKRAVGVGAIFNLMTIPPSSTLTSSRMAPFATTSLPSIPSDKGVHERRGPSVSRLFPEERRFRENCSHPLAPPNLTHSPATARSPPGGSNITVTRRLPHDGHLRHASRRERGEVASAGAYQRLKIESLAIFALTDRFQSFPAPPSAAHVDAPSRGVRDPYCLNRRHGNKIRTPMIACQPLCDLIRRPSFAPCAISTALLPPLRP